MAIPVEASVGLRLHLWSTATASLLRSFGGQIRDFVCVDIEHNLTASCIRVLDYHLSCVPILDLFAG
jgi:hypothetical protein